MKIYNTRHSTFDLVKSAYGKVDEKVQDIGEKDAWLETGNWVCDSGHELQRSVDAILRIGLKSDQSSFSMLVEEMDHH